MRRSLPFPEYKLPRDEAGSVAVEAALVLPLVIAFALTIFEFGSVFYHFELVQTGVRDAARYLARVPNPQSAEAQARAIAVTGSPAGTASARVAGWSVGQVTVSYEATPNPVDPDTGQRSFRGGDPLLVVRVATRFEHRGLGLLSGLGLSVPVITASHAERYVGG